MVYFLNLQNMEIFGWIGLLVFFLLCLVCWLVAMLLPWLPCARTLVGPKTSPSCQVDEPYRCSEGRRGCIISSWLFLFLMSMIYDFMMLKQFFVDYIFNPSFLMFTFSFSTSVWRFFIVALLWRYKRQKAVWISVCSQILESNLNFLPKKPQKPEVSQAFFL